MKSLKLTKVKRFINHSYCLLQRGFKLREKLAHSYIGQPLPDSLHLLPSTPQIRGLHTLIRNKDTPRDEFIFYSKRLIRLVIEYALSLLPFKVKTQIFLLQLYFLLWSSNLASHLNCSDFL